MRVLIVVAHGSRKKASAKEVAALVKKINKKTDGFDWITHAFLQFSEPLLPDVLEAAVAKGADEVILFPFFIATGSHVQSDIPKAAARAGETYPHVCFSITRHLGVVEAVEDLILDEVAAHLSDREGGKLSMPEPTVYVIKAGDTFPDLIEEMGNFEDWIISGLGMDPEGVRVVNAEACEALPDPETVRGAVISGAHSMVTQGFAWSLALEAWARQMIEAKVPLLGICYGHQIMARAMGGTVDFHPGGTEIGTTEIRCHAPSREDALFRDLPETFKVHVFHSQSVLSLPQDAVLLAGNNFDPHQSFRMGPCAWGVQFHPEADVRATMGYIRNLEEALAGEGKKIDALTATLEETPHAAALLRRFGTMVA